MSAEAALLKGEAPPLKYGSTDGKSPLPETGGYATALDIARRLKPLITMVALWIVEHGVMAPSLVFLATDFFAGAGNNCEAAPSSEPCQRGAAELAYWRGIFGGASNTLALAFALALGSLSDRVGRRPLFRAKAMVSVVPMVALALHVFCGSSLWAYFIIDVAAGAFDVNGVFLAHVSDVITEPRLRSTAFAVVMVIFFFGGLPVLLVGLLPARVAVMLSLLASLAKAGYVEVFFPETHKPSEEDASKSLNPCVLVTDALGILLRHSFITNMALILVLSGLALAGLNIVTTPILTAYVGLAKSSGTLLAVVAGMSAFTTVALGLGPLTRRFGDVVSLRICLVAVSIFPLFLAVCTHLWHMILLNVFLFGFLVLQFPIISAIKSNLVGSDEQGLVQGTLASIRVLAVGVAEVFFGWFYHKSTHGGTAPRSSTYPPLFTISCLAAASILINCRLGDSPPPPPQHTLDQPDAEEPGRKASAHDRMRATRC